MSATTKPSAILHCEEFGTLVKDSPLVYVDAGARGGLQGPWAEIDDDRVYVVSFEPDPDGGADLNERKNCDFIPSALWSSAGTVDVHIAEVSGTSSVHPPNWELLSRFPPQHSEPRTTLKRISVQCSKLDTVLAGLGRRADFIKIDTQGAEYEILSGAIDALDNSVFAVLAETWTTEVHKGQHLTGEVMTLMHDRGFELFDFSVGAAWHRRGSERLPKLKRRQIVGLDLLFFRDPTSIADRLSNPVEAAKAAAIAELYGFPDVALEILDMTVPDGKIQTGLVDGLREHVLQNSSADIGFASLHY